MELDIKNKKLKFILWVLFGLYIVLLITILFFKYGFTMSLMLLKESIRPFRSNFIPFRTIIFYCRTSSIDIILREVFGNVIAFAPMGFLLPLLVKKIKGVVKVVVISFTISLLLEIMQLITHLGSFDIDDMILNALGAIMGFIVYWVIMSLVAKRIRIDVK